MVSTLESEMHRVEQAIVSCLGGQERPGPEAWAAWRRESALIWIRFALSHCLSPVVVSVTVLYAPFKTWQARQMAQ